MSYLSDSWLGEVQHAVSNDACVVPVERRRCAAGCGTILRQSNKGRVCSLCDELGRESLAALRGERTAALRARSYRAQRRALPAAVELAEADEASAEIETEAGKEPDGVTLSEALEERFGPVRASVKRMHRRTAGLPKGLCLHGCGELMHRGCCKGSNGRRKRADAALPRPETESEVRCA